MLPDAYMSNSVHAFLEQNPKFAQVFTRVQMGMTDEAYVLKQFPVLLEREKESLPVEQQEAFSEWVSRFAEDRSSGM